MRYRLAIVMLSVLWFGSFGPAVVHAADALKAEKAQPFPEQSLPSKGEDMGSGASMLLHMASSQQQMLVMLSDLTKIVKSQAVDPQSQIQADQMLAQIETIKGRLQQMVDRIDPASPRERAGSPNR